MEHKTQIIRRPLDQVRPICTCGWLGTTCRNLADAKLEDFTAFFKPKTGLLWGFLAENLQGTLEKTGGTFQPKRRFQSTTNFVPDFLSNCLKRGDEITNTVFPGQSETPNVEFDVNLHSVSPEVAEVRSASAPSVRSPKRLCYYPFRVEGGSSA